MTLPVLDVQNLGKQYRYYSSARERFKKLLTGRSDAQTHWALKDVSFVLHKGQCMGVVGDNGAGKSTLLKLIAGTMRPSVGQRSFNGRVTAILELGAGFHPEFTGRDNLYFAGSLIGIDTAQMRTLEASVIEFSELGSAVDRPVKTYSSGMVVRLAFALVTAVEPDVLIVDEALAVGDQHFQKKCIERIESFRNNGCSILFCSHSLYHVRQLCDVALWLDRGGQKAFGATNQVLAGYEAHVRLQDDTQAVGPAVALPSATTQPAPLGSERRGAIVSVTLANRADETKLLTGPDLAITVLAKVHPGEQPSIGVMLEQLHGVGITVVATHADQVQVLADADGVCRVTVTFANLSLHSGEYVVSAYLADDQGLVIYDDWHQCETFHWVYPSALPGLMQLPHHWSR
jgi:lipopolysaccharide transport system ATP-binding protein